jgi:RNA polymerase-binding transcription factor DksA
MAVRKAPAAANTGAPPKKAAAKTAATKKAAPIRATTNAKATNVTVAKSTTKARATKVTKAAATKVTKADSGAKGRPASIATGPTVQPQRLRVRENEKPWTVKELATVRAELEGDIDRLRREISMAELDLAGLMQDVGDGAGDDPADAGTATFEREQEISLANNAREVFEQSARAMARLVDGSYGICESCGSPIGKNRLLAFPRATLCMSCKSKQERR